nr:serine/threonine protein kinase [Anaerolineae bacterium]
MSASEKPQANFTHPETGHYYLSGPWSAVARVVWLVLFLLVIGLFIVAIPASFKTILDRIEIFEDSLLQINITLTTAAGFFVVIDALTAAVFFVVALVMFFSKSRNWLVLFVSITLVFFGGTTGTQTIYALAVQSASMSLWVGLVSWIGSVLFVVFLYSLPDGIFMPRWTAAIPVIWAIFVGYTNLFQFGEGSVLLYFVVSFAVYGGSVLLYNYRAEHHLSSAQIQQVKWVQLGLIGALFGFVLLFGINAIPAVRANLVVNTVIMPVYLLLIAMIPISIAFSILHVRLWDVDLIINRSLVYGALTIGLGIVFIGGLLALQWLFRSITGGQLTPVALVISAIVIGGLFQPARRQLQNFVDRRLYGIHIDYQKMRQVQVMPLNAGQLAGSQLGAYFVQEPLGRGGMAEVYKGYHPGLNREVAIKMLPHKLSGEADFRKRFELEAQTVARLRHSNIIDVFDFGEHEDTFYMVMEYIEGQDLSGYLRARETLPYNEVIALISAISSALDYAHLQGLVHRDIKPSNVMLQPLSSPRDSQLPYRPVLMDFGIAKILTGGTRITQTGMIGTLDYMAPEQIRAAKDVDNRADIYALGVMTYQLLSGELPFKGDNPGAIVMAHINQPAPDVCNTRPEVPRHVGDAIRQAMSKEPDRRFTSAGEYSQALQGGRE